MPGVLAEVEALGVDVVDLRVARHPTIEARGRERLEMGLGVEEMPGADGRSVAGFPRPWPRRFFFLAGPWRPREGALPGLAAEAGEEGPVASGDTYFRAAGADTGAWTWGDGGRTA